MASNKSLHPKLLKNSVLASVFVYMYDRENIRYFLCIYFWERVFK